MLLPTDKGKALITVMPEEIQSPEMTADWETKLLRIERGEMEPSEFMTEINTMIYTAYRQTWDQFFILLVAEFICFILFFGATAITEGIGRFSEWLAEL